MLYATHCASCHGAKGEGVPDKYDDALHGDRTLESLARYIDRTMPEEDPDVLDAAQSQEVAAYIYQAFYSPAARAQQVNAKIEPARLTNRQFRESIADLLGSFGETPPFGAAVGLNGVYFQSDGMNKKARKVAWREDRALDFDFGEGPPVLGINPEQFSIAWQGSLYAPETGWYEFRLSTPNGARVYLNGEMQAGDGNFRDDSGAKRQPTFIDAWVSSGSEVRVVKERAFLLGGRSYPFRLDYFKYQEKRGLVRLEWKPPQTEWSVVSAPYLSPAPSAHVSVVATDFPADDASEGYERGSEVSRGWHEATTRAAIDVGNQVVARLNRLIRAKDDAPDFRDKAREFLATLAERAFRRPLDENLRQLYVERAFADGVATEQAVKRAVILIVKSPRFLYPGMGEASDDYAVAARLALGLWDSLPDAPLLEAAKNGLLRSPEQVAAQAGRLMDDPRAKEKTRVFFRNWLKMGGSDMDLRKDPEAFPDFDSTLLSDLRLSLDSFVENVVWSEKSDFRELLQADYLLLNPRLARFYGAPPPQEEIFVPVRLDDGARAGILTHPYLLSKFGHHKTTSPILRGVFLSRNVFGRVLKSPQEAFNFKDEHFDPGLTMREKITQLTRGADCMMCHEVINPLGYALENFDTVGRFQDTEKNKPIDAVTDYISASGETVQLHGARGLAGHALASAEARRGFVRHLFQSAIKQTPFAFGNDTLERLDASFQASEYNIRRLFVEINTLAALHGQPANHQASR